MLKPDEILGQALRRWPAVLRAEATGENLFPLDLRFGRPNPTADFAVLRREIEALAHAPYPWRVDWEDIQTRRWGRQRWPVRVTFDSIDDLATALKKRSELEAFRAALRTARESCPRLEPWLRTRAHRIVDHLREWPQLVAVCAYFDAHPAPRCYPRQIPLPVGTKFIEEHAAILRELLDVVLGDRINPGAVSFPERFRLLVEPPRVRFRFLDSELQRRVGWPVADCSVPLPAFAELGWDIPHVLVVENRDVFLCLPEVRDTLAVFGSGKAAFLLPTCAWMNGTDILYWGDCDEAGYGILSSLRGSLPQVRSLLMDEHAWSQWRHLAVPGWRDLTARHANLLPSEESALKAVVAGPWMLEQERIPPIDAERAVRIALSQQEASHAAATRNVVYE